MAVAPPQRQCRGLEGEGGLAQQETARARSDAARAAAETAATCFDSGGGAAAAAAGRVRGLGESADDKVYLRLYCSTEKGETRSEWT